MSAPHLVALCREKGVLVATAESCTGGLIATAITDVAGSSAALDRGFVTYSNEAKRDMLAVPPELLERHGAVSAPVARAMAEGAILQSRAGVSVAVTGIAGPGGGTDTKPVGLVYIATCRRDGVAEVTECRFADEGYADRASVRAATVERALTLLVAQLEALPTP